MYNNVCCQSFSRKLNNPTMPHAAFKKANSRRLLLPTGMALIVESDSEEEYEQATRMNAPKALPTATANVSLRCCT